MSVHKRTPSPSNFISGTYGAPPSLQGLEPTRLDLQTTDEAAGLTDPRFRQLASMGPEFDSRVGVAPNVGGAPDDPQFHDAQNHQRGLFKGVGDNLDEDPQWNQQLGQAGLPLSLKSLGTRTPAPWSQG